MSVLGDPITFAADASLSLGDPSTTVHGGKVTFTAKASLALRTLIEGDDWSVVVVDQAGERFAEFEEAELGDASWELNGYGAFEFTLPVGSAKIEEVLPIEREVQLWLGDTMLWGGPIVRPAQTNLQAHVQAATPEWYFHRRNFGKADRTNYVLNPDFEEGLANWNVTYSNPLEPLAGRDPALWEGFVSGLRSVTGGHSLYMEQLASGNPKYGVSAGQFFIWEVDEMIVPEGDVWSLVAYAYIPSADYRGPRLDRLGIQVGRFSSTETVTIGAEDGSTPPVVLPLPIETVSASVDDWSPQDKWFRLSASLEHPPTGSPEIVSLGLYCPDGAIFFDRVSLTLEEATRFYETDQALICKGIVEHLQDPAYSKSDLGIGTRCELTGVVRDRIYLHSEHGNGLGALSEFPALDDGLDFSVEVTPTTKTFVTHFPQKGTDRRSIVLELGRNVADFNYGWDGEAAASSVIVLGSGDGSSREEGWATDTDLFGGVTLEDVHVAPDTAPDGSDIATLDNRAAERLRLVSDPEILELIVNEKAIPLLGILSIGDLVTVRVHRGMVHVDGVRRIVMMSLNPASRILRLTVNRAPDA